MALYEIGTGWLTLLIAVGTAGAADPVRVTKDGTFKQHLRWSPDGKRFLLTRLHEGKMALWTMAEDGTDLKRLLPAHAMPHFDGSWSADGKRVVYVYDTLQNTDGKLQINACAADGTDDRVVVPHKAFEESPRYSPDGKRIVWVSTRDGNPEVYTVGADGKDVKRLTSEVAGDLHPAWSPDGSRIAFTSGRGGRQQIHSMKTDGSDLKRLTHGDHLDAWPSWSPDGKRLAYVSNRGGNYDVWLMNADGAAARNLSDHAAQDTSPTWSPDGRRIAFVSTRDGGSDVYVLTVPE